MMKKKDIKKMIDDLGLDRIDLGALKNFKFKRRKKGGKKKWALLALAGLGAAVAYQLYSKTKRA